MANATSMLNCIDFYGFNCTGPDLPDRDQAVIVFFVSFFIVLTIFSNLLIIGSVVLFRQLQTHTNILAMSLAVSDLGLGAVVMPVRMVGTVYRCWFYGRVYCSILYFIDYTLCTTSIFHLSCVAFDRYVAICDPLRYHQRVTNRTVVAMLLLSWLGAALVTSPSLLSFSPQLAPYTIKRKGCPDDCLFEVHLGLHFFYGACPYFFTMLVIVAVYARIYHVARKQARQIKASSVKAKGDGRHKTSSNMRREHNATVTLGSIIAAFFLSWLPFYIIVLVFPFVRSFTIVYILAMWLGYVSSVVNPLLYAAFNRQFREAFKKIMSLQLFGAGQRNLQLPN